MKLYRFGTQWWVCAVIAGKIYPLRKVGEDGECIRP
jgi:hypothetical protein